MKISKVLEDKFIAASKRITQILMDNQSQVYNKTSLEKILNENRNKWKLPKSTTTEKFVTLLTENRVVKQIVFEFPTRNVNRYLLKSPSIYEVIQSLKQNSYFSHYTAMQLNGLTGRDSTKILLNHEQSPKPKNYGSLRQESIDRSFGNPQRQTKNIAIYKDKNVYLLNGMATDNLGVYKMVKNEKTIYTTNIERTLIDIVVRPLYSGGVYEILTAFRLAKGKFSVESLFDYLKKLDYIYPYHQSIGYFLEHAGGYKKSEISLLREFGIKFKFYLEHGMIDTDYDPYWKLYVPKGFI